MDITTIQERLNRKLADTKTGNKPAIEFGNNVITYGELNQRSNRVARWIMNRGIEEETFIGVLTGHRIEMITLMIGILKAGCVFVPLPPEHSKDQLDTMIDCADIKFVISNDVSLAPMVPGDRIEKSPLKTEFILTGDLFSNDNLSLRADISDVPYSPGDKIYVYFTPGTAGKPGAVVGKNKSLLHFINWEIDTFGIDQGTRISQFMVPGSDAFLRDIFTPLCAGGTICIPENKEILVEPGKLVNWIDRSGINLIHCIPSLFRLFGPGGITGDLFKHLKFILLSGGRIEPSDLADWYNIFDGRIRLVNLWGPTETTLVKTYYFISRSDVNKEIIPVGKPMKGARVIVMNADKEICKDRTVGELYIRTPYRTFGYYNDPPLNAERFIQNPFNDNPNDLLYKTGERGRVLHDGNIEVLDGGGRQVIIRGAQIQLEEIERALERHPSVKEAAVIKRAITHDNEFLYAYVTGSKENELDVESLNVSLGDYLSGELPKYMLPASIKKIDTMPVDTDGKIDYKKLPVPINRENERYIAPGNDFEKKLQELWAETLELEKDRISVRGHFFELGGSSLYVITLISKIRRGFDVKISLDEIYVNPTIEMQARIIEEAKSKISGDIAPNEENIPQPDYPSIERYIKENYGIKVYYKSYRVDNTAYRVLYIAGEDKDTGKPLADLKEKFRDLYPNFITSITSEDEIIEGEEIDPGYFSTKMGFDDRVTNPGELLEEFNKNDSLTHLLKQNNIARKYEVSPTQRAFLENIKAIGTNNIFFSYDFTRPIEFAGIKEIVVKIINGNSLLRSIVVRNDDKYYIETFDSFSNMQLPFWDISNHSFDCKARLQEMLKEHLEKPFDVIDGALFRVIALKLDNCNYKLIFSFNHLIFDGRSSMLLEKQIDAHKGTRLETGEQKETVDYFDYSTFLKNLNYEDIGLENYLPIPDYLEYVQKVHTNNKGKELKHDHFEIDLSILKDRAKDIYSEIVLLGYARLIGDLYGIDKVPVVFYSHGRNYKDGNFENIIGPFHDTIPVLFHLDGSSDINYKYLLEHFRDYREYVRNSNLNFINFIIKKYLEGEDYIKLLSSPFPFNMQFVSHERYKTILREILPGIPPREKADAGRVVFEMRVYKDLYTDKLFIQFLHNSIFEIHRLKEMFFRNLQEAAEYLSAGDFIPEKNN